MQGRTDHSHAFFIPQVPSTPPKAENQKVKITTFRMIERPKNMRSARSLQEQKWAISHSKSYRHEPNHQILV